MSFTFKDHTSQFENAFDNAIEQGLTAVGLAAEGHAKREITKLVYSRGNNDKKYRLTGRLRNSITFAIGGKRANKSSYSDNDGNTYTYSGTAPVDKEPSVYIGSNVEYAPFVENGTSKMVARPFLKPAASGHGDEYERIMKAALKNSDR